MDVFIKSMQIRQTIINGIIGLSLYGTLFGVIVGFNCAMKQYT